MNNILNYFKKNRIFYIFFIAIILMAYFSNMVVTELGNDICHSPINNFENKYCGKGAISPGSKLNFSTWDTTMHPLTLLYPFIFQALQLYDDLYVEYPNSLPLWPSIEIDTYLKHPNFIEKSVQIILWILHFCFYLLLAFLFTKLWNNKKKWGKIIPCLFFILKGISLVFFLFLEIMF